MIFVSFHLGKEKEALCRLSEKQVELLSKKHTILSILSNKYSLYVIVHQAKICEFCPALFSTRCVEKPRRNYGYAYVFRLARQKNSLAIVSPILTW